MELILQLDTQSQYPLYRQLSQSLKDAIADGRLLPGSVMPSVRSLGTSLALSRSTILKAYDELQVQGYLESRPGQGTFVTQNPPGLLDLTPPKTQSKERKTVSLSDYGSKLLENYRREQEIGQAPDIFDRNPSQSEGPLPMALWKRLVSRYYEDRKDELITASEQSFGNLRLREAAAGFLARSRAIRCDASRVAIFASQESRFDLICRLLLDPGDCVAVENPGYWAVRQTIESNGGRVIAVPVDSEGICVRQLYELKDRIKFVYVTPSVLEPSGAQMSLQRRRELLTWASSTGALIIEDDCDSEYRQATTSLPAIQGLDENDSVIYMRCFGKVVAPMVRFGFMVVPECLTTLVSYAKQKFENQLPVWEQQALADFVNQGFLEKQIRNSRDFYRKRSYAVIFALTHYIGRKIEVSRINSGTYVQVRFNTVLSDDQLLQSARKAEIPMASTKCCYVSDPVPGEFVISFRGWQESSINNRIMHFAYLLDCLESPDLVFASEQAASIDFSAPTQAAETNKDVFAAEAQVPVLK
ncbi:MAG: PLP-dependent aminotransferase family protein [Cyanobacteria bacterium SZAS LIN-5]|nr:PLP-dependent aminotransferase family protein [Cyanobacteria bacterium SZAS LIN-5]